MRLTAGSVHLDNSYLLSLPLRSGAGGNVEVHVGRLTLTGGAEISTETPGRGRGGDVTVEATDLQLTNGAGLSAFSSGTGNAGHLTLRAADSFQSDRGIVTAQATWASGGEITLTAGSRVQMRDSTLTTSLLFGTQTVGGNLTLDAPLIIA